MARKRTRIAYAPRSRRNSSKQKKAPSERQTAAVDKSPEGQGEHSVSVDVTETEPFVSAKSPISEADNKSEGLISPETNKTKSKRSKRRSTRVEYRPRSRRRNRSNTQSQSSSETSISLQRTGKTNKNGNPEETENISSVYSEQQKGEKRTKNDFEETQSESFGNSKSGRGRGRKSSRKSAAENDTKTTTEPTAVVVSAGTSAARGKRTRRKSTRVAYRPRSSSKVSKQKKQKLSDDSFENQSSSSKPEKQTRQVSKKDNHPGDTSDSLSAASGKITKIKPQEKKRKQTLQVKDISAADQIGEQASEVKKRKPQQRKAEPKNQREEIPDRIRDMTVTKKAYARWKPLHSSTMDHVKQIVDSTIPSVLNVISSKAGTKKDVPKHLQTLKQRIFTRLQSTKGPTHQGDYSTIEAQLKILEDSVLSNKSQVEVLENELEVQKRLLGEEKEQLQTLVAGVNQDIDNVDLIDRSKLHRLLRSEPVNTLNLPRLPKESFERPIPKFLTVLQEVSQQLSQAVLTNIVERAEAVDVPQWLEHLSQLSDTLPGLRC